MIEIPIVTRCHDFKPTVSRGGNIVVLVNQSSTNTCQMLDVTARKVIWTLDIKADQVMAFVSSDYRSVNMYYVKDQTLFYELHSITGSLIKHFELREIKGIYSVCDEFISYMDTNDGKWIIEINDGISVRSQKTLGETYDLMKIYNNLVYIEYSHNGVNIVLNNGLTKYRFFVGTDVIAYMTKVGSRSPDGKNYVVVSLTPRFKSSKVRILILKLKCGMLFSKFDQMFDSEYTGYVYLNEARKAIMASFQNKGVTIINLIHLRPNVFTHNYNVKIIEELASVKGTNWIFNHSGDLRTIVGLSSSKQKLVII